MCNSFATRVAEAKAAITALSPQEASKLRQSGVTFVDPRPADAIAATTGLIQGALIVQLDAITQGELPAELADKSQPVVTSCQAGPMGAVAAHELSKLGFENVRYIDGGTQGWLDAGFTTEARDVAAAG